MGLENDGRTQRDGHFSLLYLAGNFYRFIKSMGVAIFMYVF
jgi:hypothetical protein